MCRSAGKQTHTHIQRASNAKNQQTFSTRRRRATKALDTDGVATVGEEEEEREGRGICSLQLQQLLISWQHTKATSGNWQRARCHTSALRKRAQVGGEPFCCPRLAEGERERVWQEQKATLRCVVQFQLHLSAKLFKQFQENCTCRTRQQHLGPTTSPSRGDQTANRTSKRSRSYTSVCMHAMGHWSGGC